MKYKILAVIMLLMSLVSCKKSSTTIVGNWVTKSSLVGRGRGYAVTFTIKDSAYIILGTNSYSLNDNRLKYLWKYDPSTDKWTQKASLPEGFKLRYQAVGFSIGDKGYVGLGWNGVTTTDTINDIYKDFWEYDPVADKWTKKADFIGTPRYGAVGFGQNNYGYVGFGNDGDDEKDFYRYDPSNDTWTNLNGAGMNKRKNASVFIINNIAYIFGGTSNLSYATDVASYNPATDTWTVKNKLTYNSSYTISRENGAAFTINGKGYVSTGSMNNDTWEYDPSTDLWTRKTSFEGSTRTGAVAFTIGNRGFVLTGKSGSSYFDDMYEFMPDADYNSAD
jgi:N-acetylneuraminic acid mutarotase